MTRLYTNDRIKINGIKYYVLSQHNSTVFLYNHSNQKVYKAKISIVNKKVAKPQECRLSESYYRRKKGPIRNFIDTILCLKEFDEQHKNGIGIIF